MRRPPSIVFPDFGYTVAEIVAVGVLGLLGGVFFAVLNSGLAISWALRFRHGGCYNY
jgi:hypothetical protein